jgi:lipid-A-disaccharide synthase
LRSILVSAGEVSGDHYIARVSGALRSGGYGGEIRGLCGAESRAEGIEALWNSEVLHIMGVSEALRSIGPVLRLMGEMRRHILRTSPDALLLADSPDFHLPLIKSVRRHGYRGKIFYISPPSVWAWRKYRAKSLVRFVDVCLPLFEFEHEYLIRAGCDSRWAGHPLAEEFVNFRADRGEVVRGIKGGDAPGSSDLIAALLPGSRRSEIEPLYPVLSGLYKLLEADGVKPVFSVAPGLSERTRDFLMRNLEKSGERYYEGRGRDIMGASDVVAGASGTATAEALLSRRYMIVMYKVRPLSYIIGRVLLRGVKFAIPNLLAGEYFFPELIQKDATPEDAHREVRRWLDMDADSKDAAGRRMDGLIARMGCPGVYDFWADEILGEMP